MEERMWTIQDVAEYLGVGKSTVYYLIRKKGLPVTIISYRVYRFQKSEIDQWLRERKVKSVLCNCFDG